MPRRARMYLDPVTLAAHIRRYLETTIQLLQEGDLTRANTRLVGVLWRADVDVSGVPAGVIAETQRRLHIAWGALQDDPPDTAAARVALRAALVLYPVADRGTRTGAALGSGNARGGAVGATR